MGRSGFFRWFKELFTKDSIRLRLDGLTIDFSRCIGWPVPHEVSVFVPRAEITRKWKEGKLIEETVILNSITVVHAPRHVPIEALQEN